MQWVAKAREDLACGRSAPPQCALQKSGQGKFLRGAKSRDNPSHTCYQDRKSKNAAQEPPIEQRSTTGQGCARVKRCTVTTAAVGIQVRSTAALAAGGGPGIT